MGEMADYIDINDEWRYFRLKHSKSITCRYCGEKGLRWRLEDEKWWLCKDEIRHKCSTDKLNQITNVV